MVWVPFHLSVKIARVHEKLQEVKRMEQKIDKEVFDKFLKRARTRRRDGRRGV